MKPDETLILRIAQEIRSEIVALQSLREEFDAAPREMDDTYGIRARASIMHDFYTGVERIFIRIAEELNGGVPRSEQWHRQLLADMTLDLPGYDHRYFRLPLPTPSPLISGSGTSFETYTALSWIRAGSRPSRKSFQGCLISLL